MNKAVCFIISVTTVALCAMSEDINPNAISGRDVNIALHNLDELISRRETYISSRQDKARTLRETFFEADTDSATKIQGYLLLGDINSTFCVDSALVCYYNGLHCSRMLHQDSLANIFRMRLASTLPVGGFIKEANEQFMEIDTTGMSTQMLLEYLHTGEIMYYRFAEYYAGTSNLRNRYYNLSDAFRSRLVDHMSPGTPDWHLQQARHYAAIENPAPSILSALEVMRLLPPDDHRYLKAALVCACGAKMQQLPDETIYYLSLAAASQILRADRDGTVLHQLGKMLFDRGDIDRSHRYLAVALENVPYSGVTGRNSQVVQSLSIIDSSYHEKLQSYTRMQYLFITFISLVIVASAVVFFLFRHSRQRRRSDNRALLLARQDIATYLRKFLELSTLSSRRLSQFCRMASRKLSANQIDSLYDIVRSGRMIEELRRDSFTLFDETFLSVYPDFVTNLNRLLLPDEHYSLQESHRLPPELRIYAFISLGITDNNVIADYCSYSLNTVYAYRAKVKSKAINRDTFDYDFLTTGTV